MPHCHTVTGAPWDILKKFSNQKWRIPNPLATGSVSTASSHDHPTHFSPLLWRACKSGTTVRPVISGTTQHSLRGRKGERAGQWGLSGPLTPFPHDNDCLQQWGVWSSPRRGSSQTRPPKATRAQSSTTSNDWKLWENRMLNF